MTHVGPTGDMPYDRELKPWPHPDWLAVSVWKAVMLIIGMILVNLASFLILIHLANGGKP